MDARCVRLLRAHLRRESHRDGLQCAARKCGVRRHADIDGAPARRFRIRIARRKIRPAPDAHARRSAVLGFRTGQRVRAESDDAVRGATAVRIRDGRRMGPGFIVDDGTDSGEVARLRVGTSAGRLRVWKPARGAAVLGADRPHRLARHVRRRLRSGAVGALHTCARSRIAGVGADAEARGARAASVEGHGRLLAPRGVHGRADDAVQLFQSRHAGSVSVCSCRSRRDSAPISPANCR